MRFLSLFSGIEAASLAWKPLGWECVAVSEIEPFPCAVLAHHYPVVPNLGDVTKITDEQIAALGHIDVVIGGSPCQDLSVAGKGAGLAGERSGLFYEQIRIFHAARSFCGARWLVWENVPGAFSNNKGHDFTAVVNALAGCELATPADGWRSEGLALGQHGLLEWAVLDAQWFGVAQRRRRVFAVLDNGGWRSRPPVLLEPESLRGDSPPSREAWQGVARSLTASTGGVSAKEQQVAHTLRGEGFDASEDGTGRGTPIIPQPFDVANTLTQRMHKGMNSTVDEGQTPVLAFDTTQVTHKDNRSNPKPGDPCHPIAAQGHPPAIAFHGSQDPDISGDVTHPVGRNQGLETCIQQAMQVRRLTPRECERLQGMPDDYTLIPWRGKDTEQCPDGPRYKALGNSMAVPVIRWIGERIDEVVA